jgi:hypothetical protein
MKTVKGLVGVIALTFVFALAAFADCTPPDPGEVHAPPCSAAQITPDEPVASAEPIESSTSSSGGVIEISVTTLDVLRSALSIF